MKSRLAFPLACAIVAAFGASPLISSAYAQDLKSAQLAKELTSLMEQRKLDSVAARSPSGADQFVAALFFPGQLLVVSARYASPPVLMERIARSEFRDVYIDLNSAGMPESRVLFTDLGADGLRAVREANTPFDTQDMHDKGIRFDGNWREDKMSEDEYMKAFEQAEQGYTAALEVLIGALKKTS
jgi:hypothetical protein